MATKETTQQQFFSLIKEKAPAHLSLVDELSELLAISNDSAYRRIRGEKMLSLDEIKILAEHFGISIDALFSNNNASVTFNYQAIDAFSFTFEHYLENILKDLRSYDNHENAHLIYVAKDIPIFHNFHETELMAFKMYFWLKTVVNLPEYDHKLFDATEINPKCIALGKLVVDCYNKIPSTEVWTEETVHSTINQLEYCWESGWFKQESDAALICNQIIGMLQQVQNQAALGLKFRSGEKPSGASGKFQLYYSEVMVSNNSILAEVGSSKTAYVSHNTLNFMITNNIDFCEDTDKWVKNVLRKSTLISGVSEKQRHRFFKKAFDKINALKHRITTQ